MGVENGMFRSEIGSGFEDTGGTPPPRIPRSTPPGEKGENLVTRGMNKSFLKIVTVLDNFGGIPNTWSRCPLRLIRSRIYNLFFTRIYDNSGCSAAPAECHGLRYVKCN